MLPLPLLQALLLFLAFTANTVKVSALVNCVEDYLVPETETCICGVTSTTCQVGQLCTNPTSDPSKYNTICELPFAKKAGGVVPTKSTCGTNAAICEAGQFCACKKMWRKDDENNCVANEGTCWPADTACTTDSTTPFDGCKVQECPSGSTLIADPSSYSNTNNTNICECTIGELCAPGSICKQNREWECQSVCPFDRPFLSNCMCISSDGKAAEQCSYEVGHRQCSSTANYETEPLCTKGTGSNWNGAFLFTLLIPSVFPLGAALLYFAISKCVEHAQRPTFKKMQCESHIVFMRLQSMHTFLCGGSFSLHVPDIHRNKHLLGHGLAPSDIADKFAAVNNFLSLPTSEFNRPSSGGKGPHYYSRLYPMNIVLFVVGHGLVLYFLMTTDDITFVVLHGALLPGVVTVVCFIVLICISCAANERGAMKRLNSFLASHFADWKERGIIVQVSALTVRSRSRRRGGGSSTTHMFQMVICTSGSTPPPQPVAIYDPNTMALTTQNAPMAVALVDISKSTNDTPSAPSFVPPPPPPMPPQSAGAISDAWKDAKDPNTGKKYWYNSLTNETTWENPCGRYLHAASNAKIPTPPPPP